MKRIWIILCPFFITTMYWIKDGAHFSFWSTSTQLREEVPVIEGMPELGTQTKVTWKKELISGIETPLSGLFFTCTLAAWMILRKRSLKN